MEAEIFKEKTEKLEKKEKKKRKREVGMTIEGGCKPGEIKKKKLKLKEKDPGEILNSVQINFSDISSEKDCMYAGFKMVMIHQID